MDSQEWAELFPTVSVRVAKNILKSHGFDDVAEGFDNDLGCSFDEEGYEQLLAERREAEQRSLAGSDD